jgi:malonyl-CoA O-methyltransferase
MTITDLVQRFASRRVLSPKEGYALWADTYPPRPHNPLMEAEQAVVAPLLRAAQPAVALDVGTGTGRYVPLLVAAGAQSIVGIDLSMAMLGRNTSGMPRICSDACCLPFRHASFDLVCSSLMVGDVEDLGRWVHESARVLKPGGHLVYSDFHPSWAEEQLRRTFRAADGRLFEIPYFPHQIDDHLALLEGAGLVVKAIREPKLPGRSAPAVVVFHAVKAAHSNGHRL